MTENTIQLEDLVIETILTFCENLAELGCPADKSPDMWFRELCEPNMPYEPLYEMGGKIVEIMERNMTTSKEEG